MSGDPYLSIVASCPCCIDAPQSFTRKEFVDGLRAYADSINIRDPFWYSQRTATRQIAAARKLAEEVADGASICPGDLSIGLSLAERGLAMALKAKDWAKGVPTSMTVTVSPGKGRPRCFYPDFH